MKRVLVSLASVALLGCHAEVSTQRLEETWGNSSLRVELLGKFTLEEAGDIDVRNVVLAGDRLAFLYGEFDARRVASIDLVSRVPMFDSQIFKNPVAGAHLRKIDGAPVVVWDSDRGEAPACETIRYEKLRPANEAKPWMLRQQFGPYTVWTKSDSFGGSSHVIPPLLFWTRVHVQFAGDESSTSEQATADLPNGRMDACEFGDSLAVCSGSDRDAVQVLLFRGTTLTDRLASSERLSNPRIFALGGGLAVVGECEGKMLEIFDPTNPKKMLRFAAIDQAAGSSSRALFVCGDNRDGQGPFICTGTPDSPSWSVCHLDQGWSPTGKMFVATDQDRVVFGWIFGRVLVVFQVSSK